MLDTLEGRKVNFPLSGIRCIEVFRGELVVHAGDQAVSCAGPLSAALAELPAGGFCRCHRSFVVAPFMQVSAEQAYKEGEGDRSLQYWRTVHARIFADELSEIDAKFSEDMLVVCEEFQVVFPVDGARLSQLHTKKLSRKDRDSFFIYVWRGARPGA